MLAALDLTDGNVLAGTAGLLHRLERLSCPWTMLLPHSTWLASYALLWVLETERLPVDDARAIRGLTPADLCRLLAEIAAACPRPTDVECYLVARALGRAA
jgi:hypothetical protein